MLTSQPLFKKLCINSCIILSSGTLLINNVLANSNQTQDDLSTLKKEIASALKKGDKNPLHTVLNHRKITNNFSSIPIKRQEEPDQVVFQNDRPNDITPDEWQALLQSNIDIGEAENGNASLALLDLDEDGYRDLIVDLYIGGTGLFSEISVYKRTKNGFTNVVANTTTESSQKGYLHYSINGRGSDQQGEWISINNRTYLAYRQGEYGQDQLMLLRAFDTHSKNIPAITVHYRYNHLLLKPETSNQLHTAKNIKALNPALQAALQKELNLISQNKKSTHKTCPIPKGLSKEKAQSYAWPWFGAGHYTFDIIADFPVYDSNGCHAARLINLRSSYVDHTDIQPTLLWYQESPEQETYELNLKTTRIPINVTSSIIDSSDFAF